MTFEQYKWRKSRRVIFVARNLSLAALILGVMLFAVTAAIAGKQESMSAGQAMPAMQDQMKTAMQDMMVMMQNTAAWTPHGLVVLQGNRLLQYSPDMQLRQTITLPLPDTGDIAKLTTPDAGGMQGGMVMPASPAMRSLVSARILPTDDGLVVVRGRQAIELDGDLHIVGQAMLPELPPLSSEEVSAICPLYEQLMMMMGQGMPMGSAAMPGMAKMSETAAPPARSADLPKFIVPGSLGRTTTTKF
jgi:hypothetical protein